MMQQPAAPISWQEILDMFTNEIRNSENQAVWDKFHTLTNTEDMVHKLYSFDKFRFRMNAWLNKHPRISVPKEGGETKSKNIPDKPEGRIEDFVKLTQGESTELPCASSLLKMSETESKGRFTVAAENINPGDVLFVERPFTLVLCDTELTHCDFCALPLSKEHARCEKCEWSNYCSKECLEHAVESYHQGECGSVLAEHVGIGRLALRVTLVAESLGCLNNGQGKNSNVEKREQYKRVMDLVTHFEDLAPKDKFHYTLTTILLVMDQIRARSIHGAVPRLQFMRQLGGRVLHHLLQMVVNGNAITAYTMNPTRFDGSVMQEQQTRIATALYTSASMMNHSCDPNVLTSYVGCTLIAKATRSIKKLDEVLNCYGPHYTSMRTEQRREIAVKQYCFPCICDPCTRTIDFLDEEGIDAFLCMHCGEPVTPVQVVCVKCFMPYFQSELGKLRDDQKQIADILYEADQKASGENNFAEAEALAKEALKLQKKILHPNNRKLGHTHDFIGMLLARQGKFRESLEHLKQSLKLTEKCYGPMSVEVSGVLDTMIDVAAEDLSSFKDSDDWEERFQQAQEWCDRAVKIVDTLLGSWNPRMQSLLTSKLHLSSLKEEKGTEN